MWSGVHNYTCTLDRVTFLNEEVWLLPMETHVYISRVFTKHE